VSLCGWEYKNAVFNRDLSHQDVARKQFLQEIGQLFTHHNHWTLWRTLSSTLWDALGALDLGFAADLIVAWCPFVRTDDVDDNNENRTQSRMFVGACIRFLEQVESVGHTREREVFDAMWDIVDRTREILNADHTEGLDRIRQLRAKVAEVARIDRRDRTRINTTAFHIPLPHPSTKDWAIVGRPPAGTREQLAGFASAIADTGAGRSGKDLTAAFDGLATTLSQRPDDPTVLWAAVLLTNAALLLADVHDDAARLFTAADLLFVPQGSPRTRVLTAGLAHLLRAHGHIALMHDHPDDERQHAEAAESELERAAHIARDTAPPLLPAVCAVQGLFAVQLAQDTEPKAVHAYLSSGVSKCLEGRNAVVRPWQQTSGADIALARLLVWRALLADEHPAERLTDAREAVRLMRRWRKAGPMSAQVILNEALRAQDALAGGTDPDKRARNWRTAATRAVYAPTAMRMRLAVAWVSWAVENGDPVLASEAYEHLMSLIPLDAAARYRPDAREKVLGAVQEHTEEAGYWLARAGRCREAVVALEAGRAISLSYLASWDNANIAARLERVGRSALVTEYRAALAALSAAERTSTGAEGSASPLQRAWAHARAVADQIAEATGHHPLESSIDYADITNVNDDGAVIYIAAAKAGGYALVVAGGHDPQYIHLPQASRDAVAEQRESMLPGQRALTLTRGLQWLAESGLQDILLSYARGRVVTLVPVGLLSLLPLHAANERGNYVGDFSAIRYTPNFRTLLRCRETVRALPERRLRLLAVNVPDGHGQPKHLAHVARETSEICRSWRTGGRDGLVVDNCTWEEFRRVADDYSVWHIACHGTVSPDWMPESIVCFADAAVTLEQMVTQLRAGPRRLAVLSACESHLTGAALPNEVVGLPTVLLQLGFSGVIATAWQIDDEATTYLMTHFYRSWSTGEVHPAVALNRAQKWLRTATRDDLAQLIPDMPPVAGELVRPYASPYYWAAFAYTGA
jgi:CHAT domain-containing protein